jgi:hypothetical protein
LATLSPRSASIANTRKVLVPSALMNVESPVDRKDATVDTYGWRSNFSVRLSSNVAAGSRSTRPEASRVTAKKSLSGLGKRLRSRRSADPDSVGVLVPPLTFNTSTTWGDLAAARYPMTAQKAIIAQRQRIRARDRREATRWGTPGKWAAGVAVRLAKV